MAEISQQHLFMAKWGFPPKLPSAQQLELLFGNPQDDSGALGLQPSYFLAPASTGKDDRATTPGFVHQSFDRTWAFLMDGECLPR